MHWGLLSPLEPLRGPNICEACWKQRGGGLDTVEQTLGCSPVTRLRGIVTGTDWASRSGYEAISSSRERGKTTRQHLRQHSGQQLGLEASLQAGETYCLKAQARRRPSDGRPHLMVDRIAAVSW